MKSKFLKFTTLSSSLCLLPFMTMNCLSSCSENIIISENIELPNQTFTVNIHEFSVPAYFNFVPVGDIVVRLKNNDPDIYLRNTILAVEDGICNLDFVISDSVKETKSFYFDIEFTYYVAEEKLEKFSIYNVFVYYTQEVIVEQDVVRLKQNYVSGVNTHLFKFICEFPVEPNSKKVQVSLSNKSSNLFDLVETECPVIIGEPLNHIEIPISLDMSVFKKTDFRFDLNLSFINSYGKSQTEVFPNCVFLYDVDETEVVPIDYLNLVPLEEGQYRLTGLKDGVSPLEGGKFKVLNIPDTVVSIDKNAFADPDWFSSIRKIFVPSSLKSIGEHAFAGCNNLTEFDLSSYGKNLPEWHNTTNLFNSETFNTIGGFVWTDKYPDLKSLQDDIHSWGLPEAWEAFTSDMYTSEDDFTYTGDNKSQISGLNPDRLENFKHYKVIKIPDFVRSIVDSSFDYLKENPYFSIECDPGHPIYETRELILGEEFREIGGNNFQNGGFGGNILLYCNKTDLIQSGAFSNMQNYGYPGILDVTIKPLQLILASCSNVSSIESYAFNMVPLENKIMTFKKTINQFGDFCFQGNRFQSIVFTDYIRNVGRFAFANVYSAPVNPQLTSIDLSCYDEIVNPTAPESEQTYIPNWFDDTDFAFMGSCKDEGTILVSKALLDEINDKDDPDKWKDDFKDRHKIPSDWTIEAKK